MFGEKKGRDGGRKDERIVVVVRALLFLGSSPGPFLPLSRVPGAKEGKLGNLLFFPVLPSSSSLRKGRRLRKSGGGVLPGIGVGAGFDNFYFILHPKKVLQKSRGFFRVFNIFKRVNLSNSVPRVRTLGKGEGGWGRGRVSGDDCRRIRRLSLSPQRAAALNVRFLFICRK